MSCKPTVLLALLALLPVVTATAQEKPKGPPPRPLDELVTADETWALSQEAFAAKHKKLGFQWNSDARSTARLTGPGLTLWDKPVGETLIDFKANKLHRIAISLYNRGDNNAITNNHEFATLRDDWSKLVTEQTGASATPRRTTKNSAVKAEGLLFKDRKTTRLLEWSVTDNRSYFLAEFLKLRFAATPKDDFLRQHQATSTVKVSKGDLPRRVKREKNGDVIIPTVPMVDQGQKGYCVVASLERVMRYYGLNIDQHEMAQMSRASASRGTSTAAMVDALKGIAGRFHLRIHTHSELENRDLKSIARTYNRAAKDNPKIKEIPIGNYYYHPGNFDGETLRAAKLTRNLDYQRFRKKITDHIDDGIPVLWSLWMGYFPEADVPQAPQSGHMRLVIGYNEKTEEIIYSDSWGRGHEVKRQPFANAYTSTTGLYTLEPAR